MSWATQGRTASNSNQRGSSADRRRRKQWLLNTFGDGVQAPCSFECGTMVTFETITVDRFPIPGIDKGTYARNNIRPACAPCNTAHGLELAKIAAAAWRAKQKELACTSTS